MAVVEIKESEFKEKINTKGKVVVDCYAPWCGPCKMISPIIDELSEEISGCAFYKMNVDEAEEIASEYNIMSIPTILFFDKNELVNTLVGFKTKEELETIINE